MYEEYKFAMRENKYLWLWYYKTMKNIESWILKSLSLIIFNIGCLPYLIAGCVEDSSSHNIHSIADTGQHVYLYLSQFQACLQFLGRLVEIGNISVVPNLIHPYIPDDIWFQNSIYYNSKYDTL